MADAGAKVLRGLLDVFVLESLEQAPKHGYALLREMADAFGTEPNRNRLYPLLGRMVQDGLVVERSDGDTSRTLYQLTDAGLAALDGYRKLPPAFLERLQRIWAGAGVPTTIPVSVRPSSPPTSPSAASSPWAASSPPSPHLAGVPYPCADARIVVERDVRSGAVRIALSACPMGAYEYCPLCPVHQAVEGIRRLTLG